MTKRIRLWLMVGLLAGGGAAGIKWWVARSDSTWTQTQARAKKPMSEREWAEEAGRRLGTNGIMPVVVAPLELKRPVRLALGSLGLADDEQNGRLSDLTVAELNGAPGLILVERQSLETVLGELNLSLSELVRAKDAVRAGKLLKADWFLLGTRAAVNGTNVIVLRVVDGRTGVLRDAGVFASDKPPVELAGDVARFARQSRQDAASGKTPVFLAIGTFEDISVNNRQAEFPRQLRGYLMAAYQGSKVTLLEREYVDILLQEVHLDLAGLTEGSGTNAAAPMQSAYWLVSGTYESYEANGLEVELAMDVQQIFGSLKHVTLRAKPGEAISREIKEAIDRIIDQSEGIAVPSRMSEARTQMTLGKELHGGSTFLQAPASLILLGEESKYFYDAEASGKSPKGKRNLEEAIGAFETVLLLDPGNREAKLYLAICLRAFGRVEEARHYYREVIEAPAQDEWSGLAQKALEDSFYDQPMTRYPELATGKAALEAKSRWFESVSPGTNASANDYYAREAKGAAHEWAIARGDMTEDEAVVEERMFGQFQSYRDVVHGKSGGLYADMGMDEVAKTFGTNRAGAARKLVELLPKMRSRYPELEPYFLATVVTFQVETNAPVIGEFERLLAQIAERPEAVAGPVQFWSHLSYLCRWCYDHHNYELAAQVLESDVRTAARSKLGTKIYLEANEDKVALGYAYGKLKRWQEAKEAFESLSNLPVAMIDRGPWGGGGNMVLPGKEAASCAEKLGQAVARSPREFDLGKSCFAPGVTAFAVDEDGLWVGLGNQLVLLDFDLREKKAVPLEMGVGGSVSCFCVTASKVFAGTDGGGLIEYDKSNHECRVLTVQDGLLMNQIVCLSLVADSLWIGYGQRGFSYPAFEGGLGRMDLADGRIVSLTGSVHDPQGGVWEAGDKPTRRPVLALAHGAEKDVWLVTQDNATMLRHYRTDNQTWDAVRGACTTLQADQKRLYAGSYWNYSGQEKSDTLGVAVLDFKENKWREIKGDPELPSGTVSAMALDGDNLWVGGMGYVALVDLERDKVRRFARVPVNVSQIQIGGGYVWALYGGELHRALLQNIR